MQRDPSLAVPLTTPHVGAPQPSRRLHPDSLGACLHGGRHGSLHRPPKGHSVLQLVGDPPSQELSVGLRVANLDDVELDPPPRQLLQPRSQPIGFGTASPNHYAGARRVDLDDHLVAGALDVDTGHGPTRQLPIEVVANAPVLVD